MPKYILVDDADGTAKAAKSYRGDPPNVQGFTVVLDTDESYPARAAELDAHQNPPPSYIDKRRAEYGPSSKQLENIIENGLAAEQARVAAIKAKFPKP